MLVDADSSSSMSQGEPQATTDGLWDSEFNFNTTHQNKTSGILLAILRTEKLLIEEICYLRRDIIRLGRNPGSGDSPYVPYRTSNSPAESSHPSQSRHAPRWTGNRSNNSRRVPSGPATRRDLQDCRREREPVAARATCSNFQAHNPRSRRTPYRFRRPPPNGNSRLGNNCNISHQIRPN